MGRKRSRSQSTSSSSGHGSEDGSSSRKHRRIDKGKGREHASGRYKPSREQQLNAGDDFYAKNKELRHWLLHGRSKPRQFAKLDSREQRKYFRRFAKRWNKGKLDPGYYDGSLFDDGPVLGEERSKTNGREDDATTAVIVGPNRPTLEDLALQREVQLDYEATLRDASRVEKKLSTREAKEEERETRATGRDRLQEKKQEKREGNREMAATKEQGDMEFGEDFLIGGSSSSFADAIRRRDMSKQGQARQRKQIEKVTIMDERRTESRKKEDGLMAHFKAMAAARYGTGS
ncbi:MAG: hypothetical protein CYPHOPRED_003391 [Cyphobasidiales sp. Tagirdzhanova-0007]|nr:MAG: hypothetical protein CYPHOPRED_003391 [Cyphobasidiales sp. Tagirdzhanova-0007]